MTATILQIRDGVAVGPLHQPARRRQIEGRGGFQFQPRDTPPLEWEALCGVNGYVYRREGLAALGHTTECFECAIVALTSKKKPRRPKKPGEQGYNVKYATDEERKAAKAASDKRYAAKWRCVDCGGRRSKNSRARCKPCETQHRRAA